MLSALAVLSACKKPDADLLHLESATDDVASVEVEIDYKVERRNNVPRRQLKVDLENGAPGKVYQVTIDGQALGQFTVDPSGEGEFELGDGPNHTHFPESFKHPKPGSAVEVGDAFKGTFQMKEDEPKEDKDPEKPAATP
jgi:hypothetical protein